MKRTSYYTETIYVAKDLHRYWVIGKPEISKNGNVYFSISGSIHDSLYSVSPITVLALSGGELYGIWCVDKDSRISKVTEYRGIEMKWYSSPNLKIVTSDKLAAREENILEYLNMNPATIKSELVGKFW